jgi:hypothetical protein
MTDEDFKELGETLTRVCTEVGQFYMRVARRREAEISHLMAEADAGKVSPEHALEMMEATLAEIEKGKQQLERFRDKLLEWAEQEHRFYERGRSTD